MTRSAEAVDQLPFEGRRHLPRQQRSQREAEHKARDYRLRFLNSLKPSHPLYNSAEARAARGEPVD
jgi:hypothetical protein